MTEQLDMQYASTPILFSEEKLFTTILMQIRYVVIVYQVSKRCLSDVRMVFNDFNAI